MDKLHFNIQIAANPEKVWDILWSDETYPKWTAAFHEGSYAKTDWKKGSKVLFLIPNGDGMICIIEEKIDFQKMVFKYLGTVKNYEEQPATEASKAWEGSLESYSLRPENGGTLLEVTLDSDNNSAAYFAGVFPKALDTVKQLSEAIA